LPIEEPWSYLLQLEREKEVLGFYMSGHPLYQYKALIKHLSNCNSQNGKNRNGEELILAGIVTGITKKRDNKGNPIAFVEFEDLSGKFEVPSLNKDYNRFLQTMQIGQLALSLAIAATMVAMMMGC
jgi:DNA polymerase-3 subunit alpha